jgi:hypothetical protein
MTKVEGDEEEVRPYIQLRGQPFEEYEHFVEQSDRTLENLSKRLHSPSVKKLSV